MGNVIGAARLDRRKLTPSCKPPLHVIWAAAWGTGSDASRPHSPWQPSCSGWASHAPVSFCHTTNVIHGHHHHTFPYQYPVQIPERTLEVASSCRDKKSTGACPHCLGSSGHELGYSASLPVQSTDFHIRSSKPGWLIAHGKGKATSQRNRHWSAVAGQ